MFKNSVMYQKLDKGGLKVMHFKTHVYALKLSWIKRLYSSNKAKWKSVFQKFIPFIKIEDLFLSRCGFDFMNLDLPLFL